jgi:hypothetical protein
MIKYLFREDEPLRIKSANKADPQKIGEALAKITAKNGGRLTPGDVVDAARSEKHPLHHHFEWDNSIAAEAYRLEQARSIIRIVRVTDDEGHDQAPRAYLSIHDEAGTSYRSLADVRSSADLQMVVLRQAERDLAAFQQRFRQLADICADVAQIREKLAVRQRKHESRSAA